MQMSEGAGMQVLELLLMFARVSNTEHSGEAVAAQKEAEFRRRIANTVAQHTDGKRSLGAAFWPFRDAAADDATKGKTFHGMHTAMHPRTCTRTSVRFCDFNADVLYRKGSSLFFVYITLTQRGSGSRCFNGFHFSFRTVTAFF